MQKKGEGISAFLVLGSLILLLSINHIFAQCGPDGTQPCSTSTTNKSNPGKNSNKTKPGSAPKNVQPMVTSSKSPLFNKLIGKWKAETGEIMVFSANGTGKGYENDSLCIIYRFTLKGNILDLNGKFTKVCQPEETKTVIQKVKIRFDENNRLWITKLRQDGSLAGPENSAIKIK